jgi:hypothetical protein
MTTAAPAKPGTAQQAPPLGPFRAGTQPTVLATGYVQSKAMTTATQDLPQWQIPPSNIMRCIYLEVACTTSANAATVVFAGDAPLNVFSTVNFADAGGTSIVGSFDSYTLAMVQKYGGYGNNGDPRANSVYSATAGSGGTGGSFNIVFRIPVEVVSRTGIAALQNQSTNSPLTLSLTLNASTAVYTTAPTTLGTVVVTARLGGYWKGSNAGAAQAPTAFGTTSYWNRTSITSLNGAAQFQLPNIGLGNPLRNLIFLNYATGGARSDANFPNPLEIDFRGNKLVQLSTNLWKFLISEAYGLNNATQDAAWGTDTGVYVLPFTQDFDLAPGAELGNGYLSTAVGDAIQLVGSWGGSSTLYELVNFLAVRGAVSAVQSGS